MEVENDTESKNSSQPAKAKKKRNNISSDIRLKKSGVDDDVFPKLSYKFKDRNIKLTPDKLSATGHKGWSSVFSTHCASSGKWYYEVKINQDYKNLKFVGHDSSMKYNVKGHVRIGYACRYQRYDTPVGINTYGFSISDVDGKSFYDSTKSSYAIPFSTGDTIGCYLSLENPTTNFYDPRGDLKLYEFLRDGVLCDPKNIPPSNTNPDSYALFSINGQLYVIIPNFVHRYPKLDIKVYDGYYHPAVSLYMGACVTVNFGPEFTYKPPEDYKPCCLMDKPLVN